MVAVMLGHQGGWDEALLVLAPIALIFVVLFLAKRKAEAIGGEGPDDAHESPRPVDTPRRTTDTSARSE